MPRLHPVVADLAPFMPIDGRDDRILDLPRTDITCPGRRVSFSSPDRRQTWEVFTTGRSSAESGSLHRTSATNESIRSFRQTRSRVPGDHPEFRPGFLQPQSQYGTWRAMKPIIGQRVIQRHGLGWSCQAQVGGVGYEVSLIVIRTDTSKPDTWGAVRRAGVSGRSVWEERVSATVSPKEILRLAGILDED